jgi:hypothetical protein
MKPVLFGGVFTALSLVTALVAGPRDEAWKKVEDAMSKGLPKTAIEELQPIIDGAIADKAYAEAIKAIGRKISLEGTIEGNKPEEKILRLQAAMETAPAEMRPVMETILARWYWHFFQQNRWRFMQRTQTAEPPGDDILTWDLARILTEIDRHFAAALAAEDVLKATPVTDYDDLLQLGNAPDLYRPTMFDFLAHEALQFYQAGEQGAVKAEEEFEIDATATPIFADAAAFMAWQPPATDETSPKLKAVRLLQKLLQFHQDDRDRSAFFDVDLERLTFGKNQAVGEDRDARYKAALERFIEATSNREISSRALAALATQVNSEGDPARAHELARRGYEAFLHGAGSDMCFNLIQQIEAKSAQLATERVWSAPWPTLDVTYRNVTKVYFRAVAVSFSDNVERSRWGLGGIDRERLAELLATQPALTWSADLPATKDYRQRTENLPAPKTLKPGFYFIIASHEPEFGEANNQISAVPVWVSDLALVVQQRFDGTTGGGFVLKAGSGEPVASATVRVWRRDREGRFKSASPVTTDANGRFELSLRDAQVVLLAEHGGHAVASGEIYTRDRAERDRPDWHTVFFTDRAIYRPGQTINYKGVSIRYDQDAGNYIAYAGRSLTIVFNDPNGKEIARAEHRTNDYGSFSGTFTAPRDRVTGRMSISVLNRQGATTVSVEEYKRPKFQVELQAPAEAAKLDAPVRLTGKATAYTGAAIGGAKVKWRVERGVQLPRWCWWWQPPATKAIAHGTAATEADGTFKIEFPAAPDRAVPAKNEPVFVYTVHADVTDTTGETRSDDRTVRAGYTALQATLAAAEWQTPEKPVEFSIATQSLDGDPQSAEGRVTIHALKQPAAVARVSLQRERPWWGNTAEEPRDDPSNPDSWATARVVSEGPFKTDATGATKFSAALAAGIYRASLETKDRFGRAVIARHTFQVVDPGARRYAVKLPNLFTSPKWSVEPGEKFTALWGTGYDSGRAFVELECNGKSLASYWTNLTRTQERIEQAVTEEMRGGLTLRVTFVRENRAYFNERIVNVPWSNKQLAVKWESFRSKLVPGQKETWTAIVSGSDAKRAAAEMVAALYDASLDQYVPHGWPQGFGVFRQEYIRTRGQFENATQDFRHLRNDWRTEQRPVNWSYRSFPHDLITNFMGYQFAMMKRAMPMAAPAPTGLGEEEKIVLSPFEVAADADVGYRATATLAGSRMRGLADSGGPERPNPYQTMLGSSGAATPTPAKPDLSKVKARTNLSETAFFFPHLIAGDDGTVRMSFTMPEALTEWKFLGFAHDARLRSGFLGGSAVTAKDLMVEPNPPRFVREGDTIEFTVKVSNQTSYSQPGTVRLTFADAATLAPVDDALGNRTPEQRFEIPARQSRSFSWRIVVPDGMGFLTYKAVGAGSLASDGEEGALPVLSRRILVTESLPLPIRGRSTKQFEFTKLVHSGESDTLRHQSLTVQMVSQPAWYAVMALPYLMEYPYECSEQVFNRLYANALARHIAASDPKIRRVFELWKNTPALDSPLTKNQDLKSVLLEETPWVRQAMQESEARRNVGLLFDANRLDDETASTLRKLTEQQLGDGLWPWFPGGRGNEYISLYIAMGFGRLRHLGVDIDVAPAIKCLTALDAWTTERYTQIQRRPDPDEYVPSHLDAIYLYARTFFLEDQPIAGQHRVAVNFFVKQAQKFWLKMDCRMCQAQVAIALQRFGEKTTPLAIMRSLKERSVSNEELGMFWRDTELSWWWYRAPIESQATMIEAFAEVANDAQAVEDLKVWLLKQKQTQDWKTTKATADAIYALLLRGENLLASDALVEVALGGQTIKPEKVEAGTGFYEQKFVRGEVRPAMGEITVKKVDDGVSWGSVHWQYLEDMTKVTPHEATPLRLKKTLFIKETTDKGQVLRPITGPLAVGDELVVRIELRTDRDMEFVHLKDQRGSGTEPVNVLSRYRYQDGLAYYESTRDTASHFFIEYLPKGTYVFEYSTRIQLRGTYQTGIAGIQCMYAPEFNSHSESFTLEVR